MCIAMQRPLVLQLHQTQAGSDGRAREWAEFLHLERKITDFNEIREEIETVTARTVKGKSCVSPDAITLKIFSPKVLSMTLIDLPGITKVPVDDQPHNIEEILTDMTKSYIEKECTADEL
jgi:dynamin 1-like protein